MAGFVGDDLVGVGGVEADGDVLEELVVEGVEAVELEDKVVGEGVLDAGDVVLGVGLGEGGGRGGLEERAEVGELRDGEELFGVDVLLGVGFFGFLGAGRQGGGVMG